MGELRVPEDCTLPIVNTNALVLLCRDLTLSLKEGLRFYSQQLELEKMRYMRTESQMSLSSK